LDAEGLGGEAPRGFVTRSAGGLPTGAGNGNPPIAFASVDRDGFGAEGRGGFGRSGVDIMTFLNAKSGAAVGRPAP
jgi:hypothetical protein